MSRRMSELTITLPPAMEGWVERRLAKDGFPDAGAYVRQLIQRDQDSYEAEVRRVRALIEEGFASGVLDEEPEDVLREIIAGISAPNG